MGTPSCISYLTVFPVFGDQRTIPELKISHTASPSRTADFMPNAAISFAVGTALNTRRLLSNQWMVLPTTIKLESFQGIAWAMVLGCKRPIIPFSGRWFKGSAFPVLVSKQRILSLYTSQSRFPRSGTIWSNRGIGLFSAGGVFNTIWNTLVSGSSLPNTPLWVPSQIFPFSSDIILRMVRSKNWPFHTTSPKGEN